jgi:acyl-CoA dehydrogenase
MTGVRHNMQNAAYPQTFSVARPQGAAPIYLGDRATQKLVEFFEAKGLPALKLEDQGQQWYDDWLAYQSRHRLYAHVLASKRYSNQGFEFDVLRYARFLEVFGYFSPAHGYSLQVTFLGLFSILLGSNESLKRQAVAALEAGGLFALGVSEKEHGSDLLGNEFTIREIGNGRFAANGSKYYIGNANCASIISILARIDDARGGSERGRRFPVAMFALRPEESTGFRNVRKINTLGVRAAYVGEFEVKDHELPESDLIAQGRDAWDAVLGTVTLGKFFLGFGSIGICEHALAEATAHLSGRILYGKPAIEMPHIRSMMAQAYSRITAMKLYAYRALDYLHAASEHDRRYLLFAAVQKAKVSTEGVKAMALLSECVGAKGFEADTYFEMALRDAQLIPGLEGSTHINLGLTAQFAPQYFAAKDSSIADPESLIAAGGSPGENPYLTQAHKVAIKTVSFNHFQAAYEPLMSIPNARLFARQAQQFARFCAAPDRAAATDMHVNIALGQCLATIVYAHLIAENTSRLCIPAPMISAVFQMLVGDLSGAAMMLASFPGIDVARKARLRRMVAIPRASDDDWRFVADRMASGGSSE